MLGVVYGTTELAMPRVSVLVSNQIAGQLSNSALPMLAYSLYVNLTSVQRSFAALAHKLTRLCVQSMIVSHLQALLFAVLCHASSDCHLPVVSLMNSVQRATLELSASNVVPAAQRHAALRTQPQRPAFISGPGPQ